MADAATFFSELSATKMTILGFMAANIMVAGIYLCQCAWRRLATAPTRRL